VLTTASSDSGVAPTNFNFVNHEESSL
jgi:hypothetical protein